MALIIVTTTINDIDFAKKLAKKVITAKLAACVQISSPITSIYDWGGGIQEEKEYKIKMKTILEKKDELVKLVQDEHPYEVAEIIVTKAIDVNPKYIQWVETAVLKSPKGRLT